jgi:ZIP family zinc transporter
LILKRTTKKIAERAYKLFLKRGRVHEHDLIDWRMQNRPSWPKSNPSQLSTPTNTRSCVSDRKSAEQEILMIEPQAVVYAALAGTGATALGASTVLVLPKLSHRTHDTLLAFSAGLMGGIVGFQLLPEAFRTAQGQRPLVLLGLVLGVIALLGLNRAVRWLPTPEPFRRGASELRRAPTGFLVFLALCVHNVPEGLSTGLGYGHGVNSFGNAVALAVAFQNIPEGLIVAVPLRGEGHSRWAAFALATTTGIVEPIFSVIAMAAIDLSAAILPGGLGFAAGAMVYVVLAEMVPESWKHGYHREATAAAAGGILVVALLTALAV